MRTAIYTEEERKKRHSECQKKYLKKRLEAHPELCFMCTRPRVIKNGRMLRYCAVHGAEKARWQKEKYRRMAEAYKTVLKWGNDEA